MAHKFVLAVALVLCAEFLATSGQRIFPAPVIEVPVNNTVVIICESFIPGQSTSNSLQVYNPVDDLFRTFTANGLMRNDENGGSNTSYTFGPLMESDNGTIFRCSSSAESSGNSTISVLFPPTITRVSPIGDQLIAREGTVLNVLLTVMGNPRPTYVLMVNGSVVNLDGVTLSSASILFSRVDRSHAGNYTLSVTNTVGTDVHTFFLSVTYLPEFNMAVTQNFNCSTQSLSPIPCASYAGQDGQFLCAVDGNPFPTVEATTEGVTQMDNVNLAAGTAISVTTVVADNAGYYICNASSSIGSTTRRFRFYVGGTPQGVSDVGNITVGETDVRITVVYNNSVNPVPATTMYAEVFRRTGDMELVWQDYMTIDSTIYYTFTVPIDVVRGVVTQQYTARATVENLQGNSSEVNGLFTVNRGIVLAGSPLLAVLFFTVIMLFS